MIHHILRRGALALVLVAVGALTGCGRSTHEAPPKQLVHDAIAGALPPFLLLVNLEQEPIATSPETVKINFKATVETEEELFAVEREVDGLKKLTLLKRLQPAGGKCPLYGSLVAHRLIDQWTLESPQFQQSPAQLGKPRAAFGALAFVAGTAEAEAAVQRQTAANEQAQHMQQALAVKEERYRLARAAEEARVEHMRKAAEAAARMVFEKQNRVATEQRQQTEAQRQQAATTTRRNLFAATATGTRYIGTKTGLNNSEQRVCLVFTEQTDTWLRAEASNPDDANEKRKFSGDLRFNAEPEYAGGNAYTVVLYGLPSNKTNPDRNSIYERAITLKLCLTDHGLEGVADAGMMVRFPVRLHRDNAPATAPAADAKKETR